MNVYNSYIKAIDGYIPPDILSLSNLENTPNTTSQWILDHRGIQSKLISYSNIITNFI